MDNTEIIITAFRDYRSRINDLITLYGNKMISVDVLKLNISEDLNDLEDTIKYLISQMDDIK